MGSSPVVPPPSPAEADAYYKVYEEHSKTLRTWLVAYGIGAPVLFLTNDTLAKALAESMFSDWIGGLFLAGVGLQVLLAAVNKHAMWACYNAATEPKERYGRFMRFGMWVSGQFWMDFTIDLLSLGLFAVATVWSFRIFLAVA